jgi:Cu/Zn superoxide dismutase
MKRTAYFACAALMGACLIVTGCKDDKAETKAEVKRASAQGLGETVGWVTFKDTANGLEIKTDFKGLPAGQHGFHVHENPDCAPTNKDGAITPAGAAGGHYDPDKTGKHLGPGGGGHKGDLPVLTVSADGAAKITLTVKGVKTADFKNRSIMIHAGGDNYSDLPEALGGGGARLACGVIE